MTKREMYVAVVEGNVTEEIVKAFEEEIEKLDAANAAHRAKAAEKAVEKEAERAPKREAIMACMTTEGKTATTLIAEAGIDIKPQAIPHLLKGLIEDGTVLRVEVKVEGKGKQRGYRLATAE